MGNRAVIKSEKSKIGVYLHWNGGRDGICPDCGRIVKEGLENVE